MDHSMKIGICFGLTSAVITTLGLMVGLASSTNSRLVVLGGILTIAIADAFSDSLGIHISEESENRHTKKEIWTSTLSTFFAKFVFACTFIAPVLFLELGPAIIASIAWGLLLLGILSYFIGENQEEPTWKVIAEHYIVAIAVIALTNFAGSWIGSAFGIA